MASFVAVLVVSAFLASSAVNSDQTDHTKMVRRHNEVVELDAHGDMAVVHETAQKSKPEMDAHSVIKAMLNNVHKALSKSKSMDLCNINFTEGVAQKNDCMDPAHQNHIEESARCRSAAELSCPSHDCVAPTNATSMPFNIASEYYDKHPMRCFIEDKQSGTLNTAGEQITKFGFWYFNPSGYVPSNITSGTPICQMPEYHEGTPGTNDCDSAHYENIMTSDKCISARTCMAKCSHEQFDETNDASEPKGCHISSIGCVRFNNFASEEVQSGTPICSHRTPTSAGTGTR